MIYSKRLGFWRGGSKRVEEVYSTYLTDDERASNKAKNSSAKSIELPLAVDLDGTLIKTDTLFEALLCFLKKKPWGVFYMVLWLWQGGRARLKQNIAQQVTLDPSLLPYHINFLAFLKQEKAKGRILELVSATDQRLADCVGNHVGIFDHVKGSDGATNLRSAAKRAYLDDRFKSGYDYAGNSPPDLAVWEGASGAYVVNATAELKDKCTTVCPVRAYYPKEKLTLKTVLSLLQAKIFLINLALAVILGFFYFFNFLSVLMGSFIGLSLASGAAALLCALIKLNDLRRRGSKNWIATGDFAISHAMVACVCLFLLSFIVFMSFLPWSIFFIAVVYVGILCAYTSKNKC